MMRHDQDSEIVPVRLDPASPLWTRLKCSRCRYSIDHPGPVTPGDLDRDCALCGAGLGAVTVFRVSEGTSPAPVAVLTTR